MKKFLIAFVTVLCVSGAHLATAAPMILRLAAGEPLASEQGAVSEAFKQYIEEKSKGTIEVQVFYSSALGDETETLHNARKGTLDFTIVSVAQLIPFVKPLGILTFPYLFSTFDEVVTGTTGESAEILNAYAQKMGFNILAWAYSDWRYLINSKYPITKLADVKNLKFRVPQSAVMIATYEAWDSNPVPVSWAETFTSLQQGVVDGMCFGYIGTRASKLMEANQKYLTEMYYVYQFQTLVISERVMKRLSPEHQKLVIAAGKYAQEVGLQFQINESSAAKADLVKAGLVISKLEDEPKWKEISINTVWPEMAEFVGGKDAINKYLKASGLPAWKP